MSSLMARLGCRDRDLVVEAMEVSVPWKSRMRLMARLRRAAMTCGLNRLGFDGGSDDTEGSLSWDLRKYPDGLRE